VIVRASLVRFDGALGAVEDFFLVAVNAIIAMIVIAAVVLRYAFHNPLTWGEELVVGLFTWMIFIGAASAVRTHLHIRIDLMSALWRRPGLRWMNLVTVLLGLAIVCVMAWACMEQISQEMVIELPMLGISKIWFLAAMPVGMVLMAIHIAVRWIEEGAADVFRADLDTASQV
jgi:TRAP-type C4-dicarboxylate transport system permease small subunit